MSETPEGTEQHCDRKLVYRTIYVGTTWSVPELEDDEGTDPAADVEQG